MFGACDPHLITGVVADIENSDRDPVVVQAAAAPVAGAVAEIAPAFVAETSEKSDGSLRVDIWETAVVNFADLLPEDRQEAWEQESGASWQVATSGGGQMQDVPSAAVGALRVADPAPGPFSRGRGRSD